MHPATVSSLNGGRAAWRAGTSFRSAALTGKHRTGIALMIARHLFLARAIGLGGRFDSGALLALCDVANDSLAALADIHMLHSDTLFTSSAVSL
jgi:hypothetical protein